MVPQILRDHFGAVRLDAVVLSVVHGRRKPHPSIYESALEILDCDASEVIFVGDSYEADYVGPSAVGMTAMLIDPARRHEIDDRARLDGLVDLGEKLGLGA